MVIKRRTKSHAEIVEYENMLRQTAQNEANIEYIAMMAEIELSEEEGAENVEEV